MSNIGFCLERRKVEALATTKVIRAVPGDGMGWKPDPKARTAGELAWLLAEEEEQVLSLLDTGAVDVKPSTTPSSIDEIVAHFAKNASAVNDRIEKIDEAAWIKPGKYMWQGQVVWEDTIGNMVWGMLFDGIHHRGQLSTYLRPIGSKVPSIYGPSADDPGGQ